MSQSSQESLESTPDSLPASEDEIIPISSPREQADFPEWVREDSMDHHKLTNGHNHDEEEPVVPPIFENGVEIEESVDIETEREDSPIDEDFITPSKKAKSLESLSTNDWLENDSEPSGHSKVMDNKPLTSTIHQNNIQLEVNSPSTERIVSGENHIPDDDTAKPATLTVDRIKIKDEEDLTIETNPTTTILSPAAPEQSSPNDSGIHSDKAPSERDTAEETNPASNDLMSSASSSPALIMRRKESSASDDLMTAVLSLAPVQTKGVDDQPTEADTSIIISPSAPDTATSSQISTPR